MLQLRVEIYSLVTPTLKEAQASFDKIRKSGDGVGSENIFCIVDEMSNSHTLGFPQQKRLL